LWRRLGVAERFEKAGFVRKYGAYFCFADGEQPEYSHFPNASRWVADHSYEVRRADFDQILWDAALETGVDARDQTDVEEVIFERGRAAGVRLRLAGAGCAVRRRRARWRRRQTSSTGCASSQATAGWRSATRGRSSIPCSRRASTSR